MVTPPDPDPSPGPEPGPDEIEADIKVTREQLGDTMDALSAKLDVKSQAKHKLQDLRHRAGEQVRAVRGAGERTLGSVKDRLTDEDGKITPVVWVGAGILSSGIVAAAVVTWKKIR